MAREACGGAASSINETLELTGDNVEKVLDEVRPYLISDGGNVELVEIDGYRYGWSIELGYT